MCKVYLIFRDLRQFLPIATLASEVLSSNLELYTSLLVLTCIFYKVFGSKLLFCVRIGLDWIRLLVISWIGLD